jgi:hypothetical protein
MGIRNLLRAGGFDWGPLDMDELWIKLVEKAVKKKFGTKSKEFYRTKNSFP